MTDSTEAVNGSQGGQDDNATAAAEAAAQQPQPSMRQILANINTSSSSGVDLPSYEEVVTASGGQPPLQLLEQADQRLPFSTSPKPSAVVVGKATCIQIKPSGAECDVVGQ